MAPEAKCSDPTSWQVLGKGEQDVCHIAQELLGSCDPNTIVYELDDSKWYVAGDFSSAHNCICTQIMYNILSACAGCQKWNTTTAAISYAKWPSYRTYNERECSGPAPSGPSVVWKTDPPQWASSLKPQDFDLRQALDRANSDAQATTSTAASASTPTDTNPPPMESTSPTSETETTRSSNGSGPNTGAIVGGVIGGLVLLGALAGLLFWLHRRKRRARDVAPSAEFLKPEYYATPPLLSTNHDRRDLDYHDEAEEEVEPNSANRLSWAGGLRTNRVKEDDDGDMLPPFTRGTYIGPSPHEKGHPERRETAESDMTTHTNATNALLLPASPVRQAGPSDNLR